MGVGVVWGGCWQEQEIQTMIFGWTLNKCKKCFIWHLSLEASFKAPCYKLLTWFDTVELSTWWLRGLRGLRGLRRTGRTRGVRATRGIDVPYQWPNEVSGAKIQTSDRYFERPTPLRQLLQLLTQLTHLSQQKTSPKIGPSRYPRFVFVIYCNALQYSIILCKSLSYSVILYNTL